MANTHKFVVKNGLQAQNISFRDSFLGNHTITASIDASDTLSFEGDAGQLFSIVDSMGGTIFSVNDISGIPSIEVDDDGEIRLAEFGGEVLIGTSTDAGSYLLQVAGNVYSSGTYTGNGSSLTNLNASNLSSGTVPDARIASSSVTQHQGSLSITESQVSDLGSYITASSTDTLTNKSISAGQINSGTFADARIAASNVTQHQASLSVTESQISDLGSYITASSTDTLTNKSISAGQVNSGTLADARIPSLAASKITSGTFDAARIPSLNASKINAGTFDSARLPSLATGDITDGTFADARIPNLAASKITSGTFADARIPSLAASKITSGTFADARIPSLAASKITSGIFDSDRIPPGAFETGGGGGASVTVSSSAPSSPSEGDLWFDNENATLLIYYDDGNGAAQWVSSVAGPSDFGIDSAEAIAIFDSAYIQLRAGSPTTIQPAATSSTDTEVFPLFVEASNTNEQSVKVDGGLKYNANTNALTAGSFITSATGVVTLDDGHIDIQSDTSVSAYIDLYCEAGTHYARLTAPAHSAFSGNITSTLPATTTTLAGLAVEQTFTADQTFHGDVTFGNATTDFVTFTAGVTPGVRIADPLNGNSNNSLVIAAATGKTGDLINATVNSVEKFVVDASGNVTSAGDITAANFVSSSDRRLKKDIRTISSPLFKVQNLRGVSYIKNDKEEVGVIAQEVETVMPEVVNTGKDGYKSVAYGNMVGLLIEAIKEQQGQIEILKEEINSLKGV